MKKYLALFTFLMVCGIANAEPSLTFFNKSKSEIEVTYHICTAQSCFDPQTLILKGTESQTSKPYAAISLPNPTSGRSMWLNLDSVIEKNSNGEIIATSGRYENCTQADLILFPMGNIPKYYDVALIFDDMQSPYILTRCTSSLTNSYP